MKPPPYAPLERCIFRAVEDGGYADVMGRSPGSFSLQAEIARDYASLALHQLLPSTLTYPALRVVDLTPATCCTVKADDTVTMVVLPPLPSSAEASLMDLAEENKRKQPEEEEEELITAADHVVTVRLNPSLRGATALATAAALNELLGEDECIVQVTGSSYSCAFVVELDSEEAPDASGAANVVECGPELFRNIRAAFCASASCSMRCGEQFNFGDTVMRLPADFFEVLEDDSGEVLNRATAVKERQLSKLVLCPATDDFALEEMYGLYYADLCALLGVASVAAWEGQLVSPGDVLLLEEVTLDKVAARMEGVDVLENIARVLSYKVRHWRGAWAEEHGCTPSLLALRVVRVEGSKGRVPFGVMHTCEDGTGMEVVLVHQRNYRGADITPVLPPALCDPLEQLEVYDRILDALRGAVAPSLDASLHTFVVHGMKENLARELVECALRRFGLPCLTVAADGLDDAEMEDVLRRHLTERCGSSAALVVHNAHLLASASPHLFSLLDEYADVPAERSGIATPTTRVLFLLCESMEAVPPMIAARATNAAGVLECGNPNEEDRAAFIAPLLKWASERHRVHIGLLLNAQSFAGWTVGLTYADITALVESCTSAASEVDTPADVPGVVSDLSCEPIVQAYLRAHGYNMVSTKLQPVRWSDVGGLEEAKRELRETIQLPILHPELFESGMKKRTGVLFYGPPGCGKTLLAKAVATEMNMNFMSVKGPELINQYVGESEKNIRQLFQRARDNSPCIVFFDELDALAPARGAKGDAGGVMDRIVSQLLVEVDGVGQKRSDGTASGDVFIIGATNRPDLLDAALLRPGRFDRLCYLGIPSTRDEQLFALRALTRKFDMERDVDLSAVLDPLDFVYTGADFFALCSDAMMFAVEDALETAHEELAHLPALENVAVAAEESKPIKVCMEHFVRAREQLKPSVTKTDLLKYEALKQKFHKA